MKLTASQFAYIYSALQAAERDQSAGERRRHTRIDIEDTVRVIDVASNRTYKAITRDICFTGLSLLQSARAVIRDQLIVELRHRKSKPYRVRCVVVNVREMAEGVFCVGCAFAASEPSSTPTPAEQPAAASADASALTPATPAAAAPATPAAPSPAPVATVATTQQ